MLQLLLLLVPQRTKAPPQVESGIDYGVPQTPRAANKGASYVCAPYCIADKHATGTLQTPAFRKGGGDGGTGETFRVTRDHSPKLLLLWVARCTQSDHLEARC